MHAAAHTAVSNPVPNYRSLDSINRCLPPILTHTVVPGTPMLASNMDLADRDTVLRVLASVDPDNRFVLTTAFDSVHTELTDKFALVDTQPELSREALWDALAEAGL